MRFLQETLTFHKLSLCTLLFVTSFFSVNILGDTVAGRSHLFYNCDIFSLSSNFKNSINLQPRLLRKFPGEICLFQSDGSVVMSFPNYVVKYDANMIEAWRYTTNAHHQINQGVNGQDILIIGSETVLVNNDKVRTDKLIILDQAGKLKREFSLFINKKQFDQKRWRQAENRKFSLKKAWAADPLAKSSQLWDIRRFGLAKWELTHINTFYEIPPNPTSKKIAAFQAGNYIVNDISLMTTFILDNKLKNVLWQKPLRDGEWTMVHDTQVLPDGTILFYDNGTPLRTYSQLVQYDVIQNRDLWVFPKKPDPSFYSHRWGGVQLLTPDHILYTDISKKFDIIEIDRNGKKIWSYTLSNGYYLQQAKIQNLSLFLEKNKGI